MLHAVIIRMRTILVQWVKNVHHVVREVRSRWLSLINRQNRLYVRYIRMTITRFPHMLQLRRSIQLLGLGSNSHSLIFIKKNCYTSVMSSKTKEPKQLTTHVKEEPKPDPLDIIDLKAFGDLIEKWRVSPLYSIAGESQSGKTTVAIQLAAEYSHKTGKPFAFFDTEGGADEFLAAWMPIHQKKYPKARGIVITCRTWQKIIAKHGTEAVQTISEKGKMKVTVSKIHPISEMQTFVKDNDICCIVYDSFTMPMQAFGINQENFPVRNTVQQMWLHAMIDLVDEYGVLVILTNHMTKNPTDAWRRPELVGGKALHHNCKVQFYVRKWEARGLTKCRTVKLDRYYSIAKGEKETHMELTDNGFIDLTEEELDAKRGSKKK